MRLHYFRTRTWDNPLVGVEFDDMEQAQIQRWSSTLLALPTESLLALRVAQGENVVALEAAMYAAQEDDAETFDKVLAQCRVMLMLWAATDKALRRQD